MKIKRFGYCECGCGQKTTVSPVNNRSKGLVKGQPRRFIKGHFSKTDKFREKYGSPADRFWSKVNKHGKNGCWIWTASFRKGYGTFKLNGESINAHRAAWILTNGPIENSLDVCHNCPKGDNPKCVRPSHMFLGTRSENTKDLWKKGRAIPPPRPDNSGENSRTAKMTDKKVIELRRRYANGESIKSLMAFSGVTWINTWKAIKRITWKHVP